MTGKIERGKDLALFHIQIARGLIIGYSIFWDFETRCNKSMRQACFIPVGVKATQQQNLVLWGCKGSWSLELSFVLLFL